MYIKVTFQDSLENHYISVMNDCKTTQLNLFIPSMYITYRFREFDSRHDKDTWLI